MIDFFDLFTGHFFVNFIQTAMTIKVYILNLSVDPSLGKSGKGRDPSAILIGGVSTDENGFILDVIEAKIRKRTPSRIIDEIIELQKQYNCVKWGVETVQFQEFLRTQLIKEAHSKGVAINALPIPQSTDKMMRIESLESPLRDGVIRLHVSQSTLLEQLRQFPDAPHDDGPDALEMLYRIALSGRGTKFKDIPNHTPYIGR